MADIAEVLRQETIAILIALDDLSRSFGLPSPPSAMERYHSRLVENSYNVLVVGEAKRGKSSFVNALIGRDILPTDVDIATSQVFRVGRAQQEGYRLRFEDGSAQDITGDALARYGSQVVIDAEGMIRFDHIIRWIEVEGPMRFLPDRVNLLDTPGLGSLYASHGQITHGLVPQADAVIYVLDSERPLGQDDLNFLDEILQVTQSVFFIQTKIDMYDEDHWRAIQERNESILAERLGERLKDTRVWPISSELLRIAAQANDVDLQQMSGAVELAAALRAFLSRVAGWGRSAEAVLVAQQYQDAARPVLTGRLQALTERSNQRRNELLQMAARKQQEYQAAWGPQSAQRSELLQGFKKIASLSKQRFTQAIQSGGDIARVYEARIDAIQTVQQAQELGATLAQDLADSTIQTWRSVCTQAQRQSLDLLVPFFQASDAMGNLLDVRQNLQPADLELADLLVNKLPDIKLDWWNQLRGIYGGVAVVLGAASLIHPIIGGTGYLTYGLALATIPRFRREIIANQVKSAQGQLRQYLQNDLQRLRVFFSEVDLATMRSHRVNEYFDTLECSMKEQVAALYNQKMTEAQEEARRLSEAAKLDDEERQAGVEQLRREIQEWEAIGTRLRAMAEGLKVLDRPVARTDVVPPYIEQVDEDQRVRASGQPAHGLRACAQLVDREVDG